MKVEDGATMLIGGVDHIQRLRFPSCLAGGPREMAPIDAKFYD